MQKEIVLLKKQIRQLQFVVLAFVALILIFSVSAFTKKEETKDIIRTKGIVIEDEQGRDRILIGAPIPTSKDRVRTDTALVRKYWAKNYNDQNQFMKWYENYHNSANGMVVLNEEGFDRVQIGDKLSDPNSGKRMFEIAGLLWNDKQGWERGGAGLNTGKDGKTRSGVGIDDEEGEAVHMITLEDGSKGLIIGDENGRIMIGKSKKDGKWFQNKEAFTGIKSFDGQGKLLWEQKMKKK